MNITEQDLPILCSLTNADFQARRREIVNKFSQAVVEIKELNDGFAYRFPSGDEWLTELSQFISFERQCCPFMSFKMIVEANQDSIWLELTGPTGTKDFLANLLN